MMSWIFLVLVVGLLAYVRLAPHDKNRWHRVSSHEGIEPLAKNSGYVWRAPLDGDAAETLSKLDQIALSTERTTHLAGTVADAKITYVTRSRMIGFPDYNTISIGEKDGQQYLEINSRLRFGRSDLGVNRKRVKGWLEVL